MSDPRDPDEDWHKRAWREQVRLYLSDAPSDIKASPRYYALIALIVVGITLGAVALATIAPSDPPKPTDTVPDLTFPTNPP